MAAFIVVGAAIASTMVFVAVGNIASAIYTAIREAIERGKEKAPGMPPPPPGLKKKQMKKAAKMLNLKYEYYNFGFCGSQGAGKSALINSLRDLQNIKKTEEWQHDIFAAAPTGEKETTFELNQYGWPEGDNNLPQYFRLWDIPGCGTIINRSKTYFMDKYLYVFDCLLVVTSGGLGEYELKIINEAGACKRPVVVVLSKSEHKAEAKARNKYDTPNLSTEAYQPIVEDTINEAKEYMWATINAAKSTYKSLDVSKVFVVSAVKYRDFLKSKSETDGLLSFETSKLINYLHQEAKNKRVV